MERKNVYIVIFVITTIIASCVAVYFVGVRNNEVNDLKQTVNDLTLQLENSKVEDNIINSAQDFKETYKIIDISNKINGDMYLSKQLDNVKTKIENGKAYVAFNSNSIGTATYTKELNKYYEILNVNGKVVDISIVKIPTSSYPIFVMLMDDGTLQKTKFVQGNDIICEGKIVGFENIVRIDDVEIVNTNQFGNDVVKYYSKGIVVTDKDGNTELLKDLYY